MENKTKTNSIQKEVILKKGILRLYQFNVGQGDHILIKLPNNEYGIIDFFYNDDMKASPARYYFENLKTLFPEEEIKISFICLSHPDKDHLQGLDNFIEWLEENKMKIPHLWLFGGTESPIQIIDLIKRGLKKYKKAFSFYEKVRSDALEDRLKKVEKLSKYVISKYNIHSVYGFKPLPSLEAKNFDAYAMGPLEIEIGKFRKSILKSSFIKSLFDKNYKDKTARNPISTILLLKYEQFKLLFAGDTGTKVLDRCIDYLEKNPYDGKMPEYDSHFIKGIHHGSKHSSSPKIWNAILKQDYGKTIHVAFSAGESRYNHPHWITIKELFSVAFEKSIQVKVNSTNNDIKRVYDQKCKIETIDWIFQDYNSSENDVEESMNFVRADRGWKKEKIGAYIYEFDPDRDEIKLIIGMLNQKKRKRTS